MREVLKKVFGIDVRHNQELFSITLTISDPSPNYNLTSHFNHFIELKYNLFNSYIISADTTDNQRLTEYCNHREDIVVHGDGKEVHLGFIIFVNYSVKLRKSSYSGVISFVNSL